MLNRMIRSLSLQKTKLHIRSRNLHANHGKFFARRMQTETAPRCAIKATFSKCSDSDKQEFKNSNCLVTLSIGQSVHDGKQLAATINLIDRSFESVTFALGDTLQRHTLKLVEKKSDLELYEQAKRKGDEWLVNNVQVLSACSIPWKIIRWNTWLKHKRFSEFLTAVQHKYNVDQEFNQIFNADITQYLARLTKRTPLAVNEEDARKICLSYLQEECAAMLAWVEGKYQFELYAKGRTAAMQATYEQCIKLLHPEFLRPLSLRFTNIHIHQEEDKNEIFVRKHP